MPSRRWVPFALLASLLAVLALVAAARSPGANEKSEAAAKEKSEARIVVLSSLAKPKEDERPSGDSKIALRLLRGECESVQVAIVSPVDVQIRPELAGIEGLRTRLHRVDRVELLRPSGPEGAKGRWPDPLVPERDAYADETRRAFPMRLSAGKLGSILVEICAPHDAAPGRREGRLTLRLGGEKKRELPVALQVEAPTIPATASLPTSFGFSALRATVGHFGRKGTPEEVRELDRLYRLALLRHRISAHGGTMEPPHFTRDEKGKLRLDFRAYDEEVAPFLEGKALPSGARATTVELRTHPGLKNDEERIAYWKAIAEHHRKKGWEAILFDYAKDEPKRKDLPEVAKRARLVKRADPRIRVLLTASHDESLAGLVDLWTPNLNCLYVKLRADEFCPWRAPRAVYEEARSKGSLLWWYQSCSSHGCNDGEGMPDPAYFRGWPSYVVDAPGSRARAMGWLAFSEGIEGELYWDTVFAYAPEGKRADPFAPGALFAWGGNGDGTLFYPGVPARIGGKTHVPLESLRLHHIRDGLEDYELLRLVSKRPGGEALARKLARKVAPTPYAVNDDPRVIEEARAQLLDFLARPTGGSAE